MADIETGDSAIRITSLSDDSLVIDVDGWRADGTAVPPDLEERFRSTTSCRAI
jgi:hypothetical protein